jgi:RNA polymerase sigma factor (sigma-70 family)
MLMAVEASSPRVPRLGRIALRCQPDQRLVALTREGSDAAFEEIVGRYRDRLVAYAARIAPAGRGEDVVQESLMRALSALRRSGDPIELRPWLYRIVRNRALNDLRDQPAHEALSEEVDGVPEPPEVAARRADLAAMLAELKSLPDAQRRALVQRELEGRSHEEIATALAVTPGAVRGLIFRARTALRDAVGAVIPVPVLRFLAESGAGGGATVAAASAGGGAVKLGVGLTVAVVAVGSGIALEVPRGHHSPPVAEAQASRDPAVATGAADAAAVVVAPGSGGALRDDGGHRGESGSGGPGPSGNGGPRPGSNSGPGSGGNGGSGASSGSGSGDQTAGSGEGGPGGSGPSFESGSSGPGSGDPTSGSSGSGALSTEGSGTDGGSSGPG